MRRWLLAIACLGACKERGTITIDLSLPAACGTPTFVHFQAVKNGACDECLTCGGCACGDGTGDQQCIVNTGSIEIGEAHRNGIAFDPPSAGSYALTYEFLEGDAPPNPRVAVICKIITVDADGAESSSVMPEPMCCP